MQIYMRIMLPYKSHIYKISMYTMYTIIVYTEHDHWCLPSIDTLVGITLLYACTQCTVHVYYMHQYIIHIIIVIYMYSSFTKQRHTGLARGESVAFLRCLAPPTSSAPLSCSTEEEGSFFLTSTFLAPTKNSSFSSLSW